MIDIMGSLLERPMIKKDFDEKYQIVVEKMHEMLDEAKLMYDKQVRNVKYLKICLFWDWNPSPLCPNTYECL